MPVYEYTALNRVGKNLKGIIDADSKVAARQKIRGMGIFPIDVNESSLKAKSLRAESISLSSLFKRVKPSELSVATRQLAILLGAGIPLVGSLEALISQLDNNQLKKIMAQVKESVNEGNSLASSLSDLYLCGR